MLQFNEVRTNKREWSSPDFQLYEHVMYLHVECSDQPAKLCLDLCFKKARLDSTKKLERSIIIQMEEPASKQFKDVHPRTIVVARFHFKAREASLSNSDPGFASHSWFIVLDSSFDSTYVQDDTVIWTIFSELLKN